VVARSTLVGLACAFVLCGCGGSPTSRATGDAAQYVNDLNNATTPDDVNKAAESLYACGPRAIDPILNALGEYDSKNKPELVAVLSAIPDPSTPALLARQLQSRDPKVRAQACYGLSFYPKGQPFQVAPLLTRKINSDREWGLYVLARSKNVNRLEYLLAGLKDEDVTVRAIAARGLRDFPGASTVKLLTPLVDAKDEMLSGEALISLARIDPNNPLVAKKLAIIFGNLKNADVGAKQDVAQFLGETNHPLAETLLAKMMSDPDPRVRTAAAQGYSRMGKIKDPEPLVNALGKDPDMSVRVAVAKAASKLNVDEIMQPLNAMLIGKDSNLKKLASETLPTMRTLTSVFPLIMIDRDAKRLEFRREAAIGMSNHGMIGHTYGEIDKIIRLSESKNVEERLQAAECLGKMEGPRYYVAVTRLERDDDPQVRLAAMDAYKRQMGYPRILPKIVDKPQPSWLDFPRFRDK